MLALSKIFWQKLMSQRIVLCSGVPVLYGLMRFLMATTLQNVVSTFLCQVIGISEVTDYLVTNNTKEASQLNEEYERGGGMILGEGGERGKYRRNSFIVLEYGKMEYLGSAEKREVHSGRALRWKSTEVGNRV